MELKDEITTHILDVNGNINSRKLDILIKKSNPIIDKILLYPIGSTIKEKIFCIYNKITVLPVCIICGGKVTFDNFKRGFHKHCSAKCIANDKNVTKSKRKTCLEKYGVEFPIQHQSIKDKCKITSLEKYGVTHHLKLKEQQEKQQQTCLYRYGVKHPSQHYDINIKQQETFKTIYGGSLSSGTITELGKQRISKIKKTKFNRYNDENYFNKEKQQQTCLDRYGVTSFFKTEKFRIISKNTGAYKKYVNTLPEKNLIPMFDTSVFVERVDREFICSVCGHVFKGSGRYPFLERCRICNSRYRSKPELAIINFLRENDIQNIHPNIRNIIPYRELDIYLPDYNLAIEFDGLYWHSSNNIKNDKKIKNQHLTKTKMCENRNIHLLHIFENEWENERTNSIWKSILKNKLNLSQKIFARKCQINIVNKNETKQFLLENHLQGYTPSSINIGLFYNNELYAIATFGFPRYNKKYVWELLRYACKKEFTVVGGFGKILSYFKKYNYGSIITYADKRYSSGNLYKKCGFTELEDSSPNYFYCEPNFKCLKLHSRLKFQKHKLKDLLEKFDESLTESENMFNNGYRKIWDCGNKVFVLE